MKPQEWIESTKRRWDSGHLYEGAQHLAAALEEIARLQAQLSQAERVVVPECGYRFNTYCMCSVPSSRVLKDGEVAVCTDKKRFELAALKMMTAYKVLRRESPNKPHADIGWMQDLLGVALDALRTQEGGA